MSLRLLPAAFCLLLWSTSAFAAEVKEVVSPNGLKAWLVEEHSLPLIAVNVAFKGSGYAYDADGKEGRSNMTAAMLTEGAGDLESNAFNEALENRAIQLNTASDEDLLYVSVESLSEHKDEALSYLGMVLTKPRFDSEAIERTRRQSLSLLAQREQTPGYQLSRAWQKLAFGTHSYGKPQIGEKASLERLDRSDLKTFAANSLTKENMLISVVGDITPEELGPLLDKNLGDLPASFKPDVTLSDVDLPAGDKPVVIDFDIPQTMVFFGVNGLKRSDPDYFAAYVMNQIIGGGGSLTARLGKEIREKRGLAYTISTHMDPLVHGAVWRGQFATRNEEAGKAVDVVRETIRDFVEHGPTAAELEDAKQYLTGSFVLNLDSNIDVANFLINMQLNQLGRDYLDQRNKLVQAVTCDQVMAMAKRLLDADKLLIVMVGKPKLTESETQ